MANSPTVGVFIPGGYLNTCNSSNTTGASDAYGNSYPTGLNAGKMIELGDNEAANLTAPQSSQVSAGGNPLMGGAYQWVNVDSGASAANVIPGNAAYIKLDSGATAGALPETDYSGYVVTDYSHLDAASLFAGVFLNAITPGNWGFIWVGAGRATVNIGTANSTSLGAIVNAGDAAGGFSTATGTTPSTTTIGTAVTTPAAGKTAVVYSPNIFYRLPN
jgi:hypothetical protein